MGEISAAESNASYIIYGMIGGIAMSIVSFFFLIIIKRTFQLVAILISHVERKRMERPTKYTDEVTPMNAWSLISTVLFDLIEITIHAIIEINVV